MVYEKDGIRDDDASSNATIDAQQTGEGNVLAGTANGYGDGLHTTTVSGAGVYGYSTNRYGG